MEVLDILSGALMCHVHVTYEVLLHMDERNVILSKELSNACGVGSLVTWNLVSVEDRRKASNIESCRGELARGLSKRRTQERKREEGMHLGVHLDDHRFLWLRVWQTNKLSRFEACSYTNLQEPLFGRCLYIEGSQRARSDRI
jgi:hypothetical protein